MPILPVPAAMQSSSRGFYPKTINGSLRFNDDDSAYLTKTFSTPTNNKIWTWSGWVKRNQPDKNYDTLFAVTDAKTFRFGYTGTDYILNFIDTNTSWYFTTNAKFRDPSAWYHIVLVVDTTQAVADDRTKLYVNGSRVTSFSAKTNPSQNAASSFNTTVAHYIGQAPASGHYLDGYMAEVFFIDGTAHTASDFGETKNGVWVPKNVTSTDFTMGTNGFHLPMTDDTEVEAFNTVLWRGDSTDQRSITGVGFNPDLVWIKNRDSASYIHQIVDSVRGPSGNFARLVSSGTQVEDAPSGKGVNSLDSDGFTVGSDASYNLSANDYVAWCWDAGANNTITGHSSVIYEGNSGTQTIKGLPFTPDLIWIKSRTLDIAHGIFDTVRGFGVSGGTNKAIGSNRVDTEGNNNGNVTGVEPNGFTLAPGTGTNPHHLTNLSTHNYVAWCWDAGDSDPVSNTNGSITSTVKASTTNGFSIVQYEGSGASATIGHGLSSAPDFIIIKNIDTNTSWACYHVSTGADIQLILNSTNGTSADTNGFSDVPTSTVINVGSGAAMDTNQTGTHIAYCWHDVTGKQKFGSYTGGTDGQKITTGFRPGFVLIKRTSSSGDSWVMFDSSRSPLNDGSTEYLFANSSTTENSAASRGVNFVSDGFELVGTDGFINQSGTYIYAAFAGSYSDYITDVNTDGSIDSRVKASDATGFSIVKYKGNNTDGATIGHGLSSALDFCVIKNLGPTARNWIAKHSALSGENSLFFNLPQAQSVTGAGNPTFDAATTITLNAGPTSSLNINENDKEHIAYCWTETAGVSKFGSYTGNGGTTTVTTGFRPSFIMIKCTSSSSTNWIMLDSTRDVVGTIEFELNANNSNPEYDNGRDATFTDTGFTIAGNINVNGNGSTYIYAAFADTREAAFWLDQSSNNNDWQPVNLDHNDTVLDSPTDNYPVLLLPTGSSYLDGSRKIGQTAAVSNTYRSYVASMAISSGKWYAEVTVNDATRNLQPVGIFEMNDAFDPQSDTTFAYYGSRTGVSAQLHQNWAVFSQNGQIHSVYNGTSESSYGSATADGDTLMIALDMDNYKVWIGNNGTWFGSGNPSTGANPTFSGASFAPTNPVCFGGSLYQNRASNHDWNFGQRPFKFTPPA